jgi:hypothetical protein
MHGGKDVENRSRNIAGKYRGLVAITASAKHRDDAEYVKGSLAKMAACGLPRRSDITDPSTFLSLGGSTLYVGAVLGVVELVDAHPAWWDFPDGCSEWAEYANGHHLMLANPRPLLTPIPVRGWLGLWTLPDDVAAQVEEALR